MNISVPASLDPDVFDDQYQRWKDDPRSVDSTWASFFEGFELGQVYLGNGADGGNGDHRGDGTASVLTLPAAFEHNRGRGIPAHLGAREGWQAKVDALVYAYRSLGHSIAKVDPLGSAFREQDLLELGNLGFSENDLDRDVSSPFFRGGAKMTLGELIDELQTLYAGSIGAEFMHIQDSRVRNWVRDRMDSWPEMSNYKPGRKKRILRVLLEAEHFERFLHTKFLGQKRFSLEGGESLMVALDTLFMQCEGLGVHEIVMGMAHRGRLNVLANFLKKPYSTVFSEFSENFIPESVYGNGDVKYHLGYRTVRTSRTGHRVMIHLAANPSHLEAVDPVVAGMTRARQRILSDTSDRKKVLPLLIHGDAAFAAQGIVAEVFNFSQLPGYRTGGTVHLVVNNQIGFTTLPADARSSPYATDVAKMIDAPIFHVNGDDPSAVAYVMNTAFEYRQKFGRDVVIDMYCFRRHGHNEGDEPMFTQPNLYAKIKNHPPTSEVYRKRLKEEKSVDGDEIEKMEKTIKDRLEDAFVEAKKMEEEREKKNDDRQRARFRESTAIFQPPYSHQPADTQVSRSCLADIVDDLVTVPEHMEFLPKVKNILLDRRQKIFEEGGPYDWGYAEALAIGSLLLEGTPVRLSGQDSRRGTFSHRHSALYDVNTRERYFPLKDLSPDQAMFCVYNSPLSEASVLGFDYGYSIEYPRMLCMWEAQFGDFANGAQVIIDQFIASAESKWQQPCGLVMLLPHGYEGQGPEHSSARIERFLQLCGEDNMQVCNLTTPAQYFHVLRRQMKRSFRKPLVIMTPKSLLRSPDAVSYEADFTNARFREIIDDPSIEDNDKIRRVILCSGKIYYDLLKAREEKKEIETTAIIRLEQLYPLHEDELKRVVDQYSNAVHYVWCQEEHSNMGAWHYMYPELRRLFGREFYYAGRDRSASPAVGLLALHRHEQQWLLDEAFGACPVE